jgi:hypothetical protein
VVREQQAKNGEVTDFSVTSEDFDLEPLTGLEPVTC